MSEVMRIGLFVRNKVIQYGWAAIRAGEAPYCCFSISMLATDQYIQYLQRIEGTECTNKSNIMGRAGASLHDVRVKTGAVWRLQTKFRASVGLGGIESSNVGAIQTDCLGAMMKGGSALHSLAADGEGGRYLAFIGEPESTWRRRWIPVSALRPISIVSCVARWGAMETRSRRLTRWLAESVLVLDVIGCSTVAGCRIAWLRPMLGAHSKLTLGARSCTR